MFPCSYPLFCLNYLLTFFFIHPVSPNFPNNIECIVYFGRFCYSHFAETNVGKDDPMSSADKVLKHLIIEQVEKTTDTDLLDLILKLLINEAA